MEADGAPLHPPPRSVLRFTGVQSYGYTDQRKSKQTLKSRKIEPETSRSESRALANWATTAPDLPPRKFYVPSQLHRFCFVFFISALVTPIAEIVLKLHNPPAKIGNIIFISKSLWSQSQPNFARHIKDLWT